MTPLQSELRRLVLFALLASSALLFACGDSAASRQLGPDGRPIGANVISNPHAVKLPISIGQAPIVYYGASCAAADSTRWCGRYRLTAYDANGRVIADALGTWASLDPAHATVDSIGWVTLHVPAGTTGPQPFDFTFTLR